MAPNRSERQREPLDQAANVPPGIPDFTDGSKFAVEPEEILPDVHIESPTGGDTLPAAVATEPPQFPEPEQNLLATPSASPDPSWQVIWKPFRSESSALGFAERLRSVTGLDIEVRQQTPVDFVVAFSYNDDEQRLRNIERIENQTGLMLVLGDRQ